jgi:2-phosphosulfolactate phosphatase
VSINENERVVAIDYLPESAPAYADGWAVVAIDVLRATTTAVTIAHTGRRCIPAPSPEAAREVARDLVDPLLVGEFGGELPDGFHLQNSPATLEVRDDLERPAVLVSSSGTRLIHEARRSPAVYPGSLRNAAALVEHLAARHPRVAVIGAGTKGEFRREDQYGCARIASGLLKAGYRGANEGTVEVVERWRGKPVGVCAEGRSAEYLRRTGQTDDLDFVLTRIDDV